MKTRIRLLALVLAAVLCWGLFPYSVIFAEFDEHDFDESDFAEPDIAESATPYENEYTEPVAYSPSFFLPDNMRGIIISPEVDFLLSPGDSADEVNAQLDAIFDYIEDIGINAVYIKTSVEDRAYYDLDMNRNGRTDFLKLAVERAQSRHLGVYIIFDIGRALKAGGSDAPEIDRLSSEAHRLTIKYPCDGIILDDYYNDPEVNDFPAYMRNGSGIGYENWLYDSTEYLFGTASAVVRMTNNTIPVGVMINDVWANASSMPGGSPTNDSVQAFFDGFADTKKYVEQGYADFLLLRCYGSLTDTGLPFDDTAEWWGELCEASGIPMYLIHYNEKIGNGWAEDQLLRQLKTAKEDVPAYSGSIFNSYAALRENTLNSAGKLKEYFAGLIDEESLMQDLEMYSPKNLNFTTFEPIVEFAGRFDSNFDVYFNGSKITLNEAGNFYFPEPLQIGMNTFTIRHKDRTYTYRIERRIIVMREIDASIASGKTLRVDGATNITLEAVAYKGANVTATINGQTVRLQEQSGTLLDEDINSAYTSFTGRYRVPDGIIGKEQALGNITVQASYLGQSSTIVGAGVYVNAEPEPPPIINLNPIMYDESSLGTGEVVGRIGATRGRGESVRLVRLLGNNTNIFDAKTTGTVFDPRFGQLPAGTLDYYRSDVGDFYTTESGKRFLKEDAALENGQGIGENALVVLQSGTSGGRSYFEIALDTKISYNVEAVGVTFFSDWGSDYNVRNFDAQYIHITFDNVTSVTKLPPFDSNLVFSSGRWEQVTIDGVVKFRLVLRLRTAGLYAGNNAYYNANGNLMLTFPVLTNSLAGMTIVIDPGHGINANGHLDPGAIGHITEYTANLAVAKRLESRLRALGANVIRLRTEDSHIAAKTRPVVARTSYNCDLFISIHSNKASRADARGTEVFYYTPFSQPLASAISSSVAGYFTNNVYSDGADKNRGAKNSYFWVTVQQDFPSVMVELGFVSNLEDAMALANETHQDGIAAAIVRGIQNYLARSPLSYSTGGSAGIPDHFAPAEPDIITPAAPAPAETPEDTPAFPWDPPAAPPVTPVETPPTDTPQDFFILPPGDFNNFFNIN